MTWLHEITFGWRGLWRSPANSIIAVITLGLGMGLVSFMLSYVNGVIVRGLPFDDAGRIVYVQRYNPDRDRIAWIFREADYLRLGEAQSSLDELVGFRWAQQNVRVPGQTPSINHTAAVTPNFLKMLRLRPAVGRDFDASSSGDVVLIGHHLWRDWFDCNDSILGTTLWLDGEAKTIVGVMPKDFRLPRKTDVWRVMEPQAAGDRWFNVIGRLKEGVSKDQAAAELSRITGQISEANPERSGGYRQAVVNRYTDAMLGRNVKQLGYFMLGCSLMVLLLSCANVSNLLFARVSRRVSELAVRSALGASRARLFSQLIVESLWLALGGAILGVVLAKVAGRLLDAYTVKVDEVPFWMTYEMNWGFFGVVAVVTAAIGVVAGLFPAWKATRASVAQTLQDGSRSASSLSLSRLTGGLVAGQIAISLGLLCIAWMLVRNIQHSREAATVMNSGAVLAGQLVLPESRYAQDDAINQFHDALLTSLQEHPAISQAAVTTRERMDSAEMARIRLRERVYPDEETVDRARLEEISPDYFATLDVPILQGRAFRPGDKQVAIINSAFVKRYFPEGDVLGKQIGLPRGSGSEWVTIIGVVPNLKMEGYMDRFLGAGDDGSGFYMPLAANPSRKAMVLVRGRGDFVYRTQLLRAAVAAIDADLALHHVSTLKQAVADDLAVLNVISGLFTAFGLAATFLAAVGFFGVVSFAVNQRLREIGLRMALGARRLDILALILNKTTRQWLIGVLIGLILTWFLGKGITQIMPIMKWTSPIGYLLVLGGFFAVLVLGIIVPLRRALSVQPNEVLRQD